MGTTKFGCAAFVLALVQLGCAFDWDAFDPRGETTPLGGAGGMAQGGEGGVGGFGGAAGGSGGAVQDCVLPISDDFSQMQDSVWNFWSNGVGCTSAVVAGELSLSCDADPNSRQAGVTSLNYFDFTGCEAIVEVTEHAMVSGANYAFVVASDEGDSAGFTAIGGSLAMDFTVSGSENTSTTGLDTSAHAWWRLCELDSCISFDTSPDGTNWQTLSNKCNPAATWTSHRIILSLTAFDEPGIVDAAFDNLNNPPGN